jgi:hypothetical protein
VADVVTMPRHCPVRKNIGYPSTVHIIPLLGDGIAALRAAAVSNGGTSRGSIRSISAWKWIGGSFGESSSGHGNPLIGDVVAMRGLLRGW